MPLELRNMETEPPIDKLKLALVGAEQNGKSRLAATARKPVLFHDFDNKSESLRGLPGVFVISYVDPQWPMQPTAAQDWLTIVSKLEESLDLGNLGFTSAKGVNVRTNVIDSITTLGEAVSNYAMYNSTDLRREVKFGGHKVFIQASWDAWRAEMLEVRNNLLRLMALPTDTIITLHETAEETPDSTPEKKKFTGKIDVYPSRYRMLLKYFPEIWRVKLTQSVVNNRSAITPKVFPLPTYEFDCGTTLLLDPQEEPNIEVMLAKHEQRLRMKSPAPHAAKQIEESLVVKALTK